MYKLSKEEIQFIDTYLENSGVKHADIRMEMVDHVASGIEEVLVDDSNSFYDTFKAYMVANKHQLLKDNKKFISQVDIKIMKRIVKNILSIPSLIILIITYFGFVKFKSVYGAEVFKDYLFDISILGLILLSSGYFLGLAFVKMNRFVGVERMVFPFMIFVQLSNMMSHTFKNMSTDYNGLDISVLVLSMLTLIVLVLLQTTVQMHLQYKRQYKNLV